MFSPNGKWLAYVSNEPQVYVVPFPAVNAKIQVSKDFSYRPKWSRGGRELFYLTDDNMLTVASLQEGKNGLQVNRTAALFKVETPNFDVSPDGQRILIYRPTEKFRRPSITLITNWPALLPKK